MALNLEAKKVVVKQVNALAKSSIAVGVAEYRGLTVEQMTNLRASAMDASVSLRVVKNSLAQKPMPAWFASNFAIDNIANFQKTSTAQKQ